MVTANEQRNHCDKTPTKKECTTPRSHQDKEKAKDSGTIEPSDRKALRQHWYEEYEELLQGVPDTMPSYQVVNHEIPLVDTEK